MNTHVFMEKNEKYQYILIEKKKDLIWSYKQFHTCAFAPNPFLHDTADDLEFNGPVNTIKVMLSRSVYLNSLFS